MGANLFLSSKQKALEINLNKMLYGTFAEIGAGQEVARNFFRAGGAAGTVAKTMSAYDMVVSDDIYGKEKSGRYVCESRCRTMLEKEFHQTLKRLRKVRPAETKFFAFANTVAAKSFLKESDCHGWLGVLFQTNAGATPSEVILHVRMLDRENLQQQEALGSVGVNLLYACFFHLARNSGFVESLLDNLGRERIEIDMIRVSGPAFQGVDSRLLNLELVKNNFTDSAYFDNKGKVQLAKESLYRKNILVLRGSFRPPNLANMDMLESGVKGFQEDLEESERDNILVLPEISMSKLIERGVVNNQDFLARVDLLAKLGQNVLISKQEGLDELNTFLLRCTKGRIAFVLSVYNLLPLLNPKSLKNKKFGLLGTIGKIFGPRSNAYFYPASEWDLNKMTEKDIIRLDQMEVDKKQKFLLKFLLESGYCREISKFNHSVISIWSRKVLDMIQKGDKGFEKMVPEIVAKIVREKKLFGHP